MLVLLRTIADRLIVSNANLKYIAANLPEDGLERVVEGPGWTVRQLLGHLAGSQDEYYARVIDRWLRDERPARDPHHDVDTFNAETVRKFALTPLPEIVEALDRSLGRLVEMFQRVDEAKLKDHFAPWPPLEVFEAWSRHIEAHAPDLIEALPGFKRDPMVLNWVLGIDFEGNQRAREWQMRLAGEVREMFQLQGEA